MYHGTVDGQHTRRGKKCSFKSLLEARFIQILTPQMICREGLEKAGPCKQHTFSGNNLEECRASLIKAQRSLITETPPAHSYLSQEISMEQDRIPKACWLSKGQHGVSETIVEAQHKPMLFRHK